MTHSKGWLAILFVALTALAIAGCSSEPEGISLEELSQKTHIHGLAFDRADSERLLLATHHGFHVVGSDGLARQVSSETHDFMGFTPYPDDHHMLFASGHSARGGNLGVQVSTDGGRSWSQRSPGVNGPVDFHQMTVSPADPEVLYGAYAGQLQVSRDAGQSWRIQAQAPEGLIGLAASSRDPNQLYAATQEGLLLGLNGGQRWRSIHPARRPVSVVVSYEGQLLAFMLGVGLIQADESSREWQRLSGEWGEHYLTHLAIDPRDSQHLVAANDQGQLLRSNDGGNQWRSF